MSIAMDVASRVPPVRALVHENPAETSFMRYFAAASTRAARTWTPLSDVSPLLVAAVVKAEDPRFFDHHGVDLHAVARKTLAALRAGRRPSGASTIVQQLARNLYLTPVRSPARKLRELWLALGIDRRVPKPRILELYLNVIEWGPDLWGCAAASAFYFDKPPHALNLFESTFLAGLIPAPKAALAGRNAARCRYVQTRVAYQLLLSGLIGVDDCALCVHRVRTLHRALTEGTPAPDALALALRADAAPDAPALHAIVDTMNIPRLTVEQTLSSRCGARQERAAWRALRSRFGQAVLAEVVASGSHAALLRPRRS